MAKPPVPMLDSKAMRSGSLVGRSATLANGMIRPSGASWGFVPFRRAPRHQQQQQQPGRQRSRRQERATMAPRASWAPSTAVGRPRSAEVVGVVIVDAGQRTPEGDDLLIDFAAAYGQAYKRGIVAVASPDTLETAVRDCVEEGADKIMVVPYLLSCGREVDNDLPMALADVQLQLPGIRCIIGETISVSSLLTQHIENQVKAVEVKAPAPVEERWWSPEPPQAQESRPQESRPQAVPAARAGMALPPAEKRQVWGEAVQHASPEQQPWDVEVEDRQPLREAQPIAVPKPAAAPKTAVAWSDDFSAALTGGVLVVDYRKTEEEKKPHRPAAAGSSQRSSRRGNTSHAGSSWGGDTSHTGSSWSDDISSAGSSWGDYGASHTGSTGSGSSNRMGASSTTTSTSDGPAYWYSNSSSTEEDTRTANGRPTYGASSGKSSSHSAAGTWYSSTGAASAESGVAAAAGVAAGAEGVEAVAPLADRLAHMEEQLQTITELLVRSRVGGRPAPGARRNAPRRRQVQPHAADAATSYSPSQLEFLKRKEGGM